MFGDTEEIIGAKTSFPHWKEVFKKIKREEPLAYTLHNNPETRKLTKIGHWYLDERETYIRIFRTTGAPHLLPIYVPDSLVLGEIFYQTILQ
jgi:hypothetical protein